MWSINMKKTRSHKPAQSKITTTRSIIGAFSLGITKIYEKRSDLYREHLERKMNIKFPPDSY